MATPEPDPQAFYPIKEELRDLGLNSFAERCDSAGLTVNTLPNSEHFFKFDAIAQCIAPAYANNRLAVKALNPIDAEDPELSEQCELHGVPDRPAAASTGKLYLEVVGSNAVTVPVDFVGTLPDGTQVTTTETLIGAVDGDRISVAATIGGSATNKAPGTLVTWDDTSITYLKQTASVDEDGLTGGADADSVEDKRGRLIERLSSPANGGNWSFVRQIARDTTASIDAAFVYPASQGPGSTGVVVISNTGNRSLSTDVTAAVAAALVAATSGKTKWNVTSTVHEPIDVILSADLPASQTANGPGGGWLDDVPWPNAGTGPVKITATDVANAILTVNVGSVGQVAAGHHIAIWDYEDGVMYHHTVVSATDMGADVDLVISPGPAKDFTDRYVTADSENSDAYAAAFLEAFLGLGPSEKTSAAYLLPRAFRRPTIDEEYPTDVTNRLPAAVMSEFSEIRNLTLLASYESGTTTPQTTPSIPAASVDPPFILVLRHFAIIEA